MDLFLVRHGIAEDPEEAMMAGRRDPERRLTEEGRHKTKRVAQGFRKHVSGVDTILHSPYLRARETAEFFCAEFPDSEVLLVDALVPMRPVRDVVEQLRKQPAEAKVLLVGHEPHLSTLASFLITGREVPVLEMRKAGIARIAWNKHGLGHLVFLLQPKFLL